MDGREGESVIGFHVRVREGDAGLPLKGPELYKLVRDDKGLVEPD